MRPNQTYKRAILLSLLTSGIAVPAMPAFAQSAPAVPPAAAPAPENTGIQDVIVTARRREESIQKVPVAVTAVTGAELESRSAANISEVAAFAPNLRFSEAARGGVISNVTLRGQSNVNSTIANDPAVGIYFDEVYVARSAGALFTTVQDMSGVEVLRGNQGTLFGRNSTGGAILLTPNRPNLEKIEGSASVSYGNINAVDLAGVLSVPIVEGKLAIRGSIQRSTRDGFSKSLTTGVDTYGNRDRIAGRIAIRYQPIDDLTFDATYDFTRVKEAGASARNLLQPVPAGISFYDTLSGIAVPNTYAKVEGYTFRGVYQAAPEAQIKAIIGYRTVKFDNNRDVDGLPITSVDARLLGNQNQFTAEFQVSGDFQTSLSWLKKIGYVTGFYYFTETGLDQSITPLSAAVPRISTNNGQNDSIAGYGQLDLQFTDQFSAFAGIRRTRDTRQLSVGSTNGATCSLTGNPPGCVFQGRGTFSFWSWNVGARYAITPSINVYVRASKGQRSGGLDDTPTNIVSFQPEILQDYEIGVKADLFDHHVRTNLALFTGDYDNIQRSVLLVDPNNVPYSSVFNAAKARVRGIELETTVQPVDFLRLQGSLGYTDARYTTFVDTRPGPTRGTDASNNSFPQVPKWTWSVSGDLNVPTSIGKITARVDYSWRSQVFFEVFNTQTLRQPGYGLVNARLALAPTFNLGGFDTEIALFGKNLGNTKYNVDGVSFAGGNAVVFRTTEPQTYGAELKVKF